MGFTKYRWFAQSFGLLLFAVLFSGLNQAQAQNIVALFDAKPDTTCNVVKLDPCGDGVVTDADRRFIDDGTNDGNYQDSHMRADTVEICPEDKWSRVQVVFTDFDLEEGDSLHAFDGNKAAVAAGMTAIGCGTGAGVGVANAFGGWKNASCDPAINPTGCLTFVFETDGDNRKGTGWDAWVDCQERNIVLSGVTINDVRLQCKDTVFADVTLPAPTVTGCGVAITDSVFLRVMNQHGEVCIDEMLSKVPGGLPEQIVRQFAIGQYMAVYKLKSDTTKTLSVPFAVQAPALVANDEVRVPFGAACMIVLTPDDVLEQPCDTNAFLQYNITVTIGEGKDKVELVTTGHNMAGMDVQYPIITGDTVKAAGVSICGGTATVRIERLYYQDLDKDGNPDLPAVVDCDNGVQALFAETIIRFSDESKPWVSITPGIDTIIGCDTTGLAAILGAEAIDNCDDDIDVTYTVTLAEEDPCFASAGKADTTTATIVFSAVDDCGNIGTASKVITMIRPDITDPRFIDKSPNVTIECNETAVFRAPRLKIGTLKNGVFTSTGTVQLNTETYVCGYILVENRETIPATDCGDKKFIYWDALDWCDPSGGPVRVDTTFIETTDETAPTFNTGEGATQILELDHFSCTFDIFKLTQPKASDNCDLTPEVSITAINRIEDGGLWPIDEADWTALDCDSFQITWTAEDDCHEQTKVATLNQIVVIKDVTKPSAACQDQLNVSLPNEWGARIHYSDIDAGSYDACGIKAIEIRIRGAFSDPNAGWDTIIDIGCEYVHPDLQVEMRVTDNKDNQNICWLDVVVEDKINPFCEDIADVNKECDDFHNGELGDATDVFVALEGNLLAFYNANFGDPAALKVCEDNLNATECGDLEIEQQYKLSVWPCGEQMAVRRYRAIDWSDNVSSWVEQNINITYEANWSITFPADWEGACGATAPAADIVVNNGACDLLGYEVTEKQFDIPGDACFKIERTYHVINWCTYQAGQDPVEIARVEGDHNDVNVQVLRVHDDVAPVVTVIDPEPCIDGVEFDAEPYGEEDITPGSAPFECDEEKTWIATATDCSSNITWEGRLYNKSGQLVKTSNTNEITYIVSNKETFFAE